MKRVVILVGAAMMMAACGGGSGSASKSKLKTNGIFGNIPALYAEYQFQEKKLEDAEAKVSNAELASGAGWKAINKAQDTFDAFKKKYEADMEAAWEELEGKEVPYTCSDALGKLPFKVTPKITNKGIRISVIAKQDFEVNDNNDFVKFSCLFIAKNGSIIYAKNYNVLDYYFEKNKSVSFIKDQNVVPTATSTVWGTKYTFPAESGFSVLFDAGLGRNLEDDFPECWADFASIKFVTSDECSITFGETCVGKNRLSKMH
jgi:hypothetical protein